MEKTSEITVRKTKDYSSAVMSGYISRTDIARLMGELHEGQSLVITATGSTYEVRKGKVRTEKLIDLEMKLERNVSKSRGNLNDFDTQGNPDNPREEMHSASFATPVVVKGFKNSWELACYTPSNYEDFVASLFLDKLFEKIKSNDAQNFVREASEHSPIPGIRLKFFTNSYGETITEITISGYPIVLAVNDFGRAKYFIHNEIKTKI